MTDKSDPIAHMVALVVGHIVGQGIDGAVTEGLCRPETAKLLKECIPGIATGVASICPDGVPDGTRGDKLIVFANTTHNLSVGLHSWPTFDGIEEKVKEFGFKTPDLWAAITHAIDKNSPEVAIYALMARLGAAGFAKLDTSCDKFAKDGFTPVVLVACRLSPDHKRASGFCTAGYLPGRPTEPVLH